MFKLELYDSKGKKLELGDMVQINTEPSCNVTFFSEVKYLEKRQIIVPFHNFSFHTIEKIDKLPDKVKLSDNKGYNLWSITSEDSEDPEKEVSDYLLDWLECENLLAVGTFRIKPFSKQDVLFQANSEKGKQNILDMVKNKD